MSSPEVSKLISDHDNGSRDTVFKYYVHWENDFFDFILQCSLLLLEPGVSIFSLLNRMVLTPTPVVVGIISD